MKFLLLCVICCITIAYTLADPKDEFMKVFKECGAEENVGEDDLKAFIESGLKAKHATEPIKCHMKCVMEKQGLLKDGTYDSDTSIQRIKEIPELEKYHDTIESAINKCKDLKGDNDCETAFLITECVQNNIGDE